MHPPPTARHAPDLPRFRRVFRARNRAISLATHNPAENPMNTVQLSSIIIKSNRQRQEFDPEALQELKNSIEERGLLHAPVLRQEGEDWVLVAGERRLKAIEEIFALGGQFTYNGEVFDNGYVPFTDLGSLSLLEAEEAELDENLKRRDLTWQEHAAAVARLHALRQAQKEQTYVKLPLATQRVTPPPAQTVADTAEELTGRRDGGYQDTVRKEILVAKYLDNPVVAKAKSADEAFKLLRKEEERQRNIKLAATVGATFNAGEHQLFQTDFREWMKLPEAQARFDVILTDPPYGMGADGFGDAAGKLTGLTHEYDDSYETWQALMREFAPLSFAVTKSQAHAYVFCDFDRFHELKSLMETAGWYVFRTPLVVHKLNSGRVPLPDMGPRRQYEIILYAIKGKKPVTHIYPDVVAVSGDDNLGHGAQKPVALFQNLLQRSVRPGDEVLDVCAGTGVIFPAAHTYKVKAVGLEKEAEYYGIALKRLEDLRQAEQPALF